MNMTKKLVIFSFNEQHKD